jgi:hypothetical protein
MRLGLNVPARALCGAACLLSLATTCGCAPKSPPLVTYMHPERLYLRDQPCARIYVEVDRTEGVRLPKRWADELKAFFEKCCLKPQGVDVVLDAPLPADEYQGLPIGLASVLCIDGPPANDQPPPAYAHVFVYDGGAMFKGAQRNPGVVKWWPTGIFINVDYGDLLPEAAAIHIIRHESGHVLGLCQNTAHGDGAHCANYGCLMCPMPDWLSTLGANLHLYFREHRLCGDCERDLSAYRQGPPEESLSFVGPFLIRKADGYCVASLPFCDLLIGSPTPGVFDWRRALSQTKAGIRQSVPGGSGQRRLSRTDHLMYWANFYGRPEKNMSPEEVEQKTTILTKALKDPSPGVRRVAAARLKEREEATQSQKQ